eukprot:TRINITY_DN28735_c0_g1_i1.p1 TRINITY_DN28735_c0_g1~~TRINITY_DN28735_c0_g1_i1.p1  ORF type:complete len:173 (-),score=12.16 TRINITY_DN28735_c0_g1_i1:60-518(-)
MCIRDSLYRGNSYPYRGVGYPWRSYYSSYYYPYRYSYYPGAYKPSSSYWDSYPYRRWAYDDLYYRPRYLDAFAPPKAYAMDDMWLRGRYFQLMNQIIVRKTLDLGLKWSIFHFMCIRTFGRLGCIQDYQNKIASLDVHSFKYQAQCLSLIHI